MEKVKCIEDYEDLILKRIVKKDDEFEVTKERAEYLVDIRKLCVRIEVTEETTEGITEEDTIQNKNNQKNEKIEDKKQENKNNKKG